MADFSHTFWHAKNELEGLHKSVKDMTLSLDALVVHFPDLDLGHLKEAIKGKQDELSNVTKCFEQLEQERVLKMTTNLSSIKTLFDEYKKLEKLGYTENVETDTFMTEMSKLMYPNTSDNLQLRSDPPIMDVFKVKRPDFDIETGNSNVEGDFDKTFRTYAKVKYPF